MILRRFPKVEERYLYYVLITVSSFYLFLHFIPFFLPFLFADMNNPNLHSIAHTSFGKDTGKYDILESLLSFLLSSVTTVLMLACPEMQMLKLEEQQFLGEAICNLSDVCLLWLNHCCFSWLLFLSLTKYLSAQNILVLRKE